MFYTGTVYMGTNMEPMWVNFDTGSYYTLCKVHTCATCTGNWYDFSGSRSFSYGVGEYTEEYMDGTTIQGDFVKDAICVSSSPSSCGSDYDWLAIR